jgi:adenylate cyclase
VTTPLHDRCPGVVVHGVIFNAIMTNHFWRAAPGWVTPIMTLMLGLLTAMATAWMSPVKATITAVAMLATYLLLNGVMMFDRFGIVVGIAGPMTAIAVVWAGCVLMRTLIEARERALVTRRFQAYVDPTLVNYVLENPAKARLDGEVKELTVVFTDLANFTTLSEKLGEKSVSLLNDYMARMVPIIRGHHGYLNKFLGDGIMCFYGAPRDSAHHASDAVQTALDMQQAMKVFNDYLAEQDLPSLAVRVGISTGRMVVGDAGSDDASDYTVLGDAVNFGSRLEGANKYLGTRVLVSERTAELAKGGYLFRPVGRLRVVGKTEGVGVFEAVGALDRATDEQKKTMELTRIMVEAYQAGRFAETMGAADGLDAHLGMASKLAAAYRERAKKCLEEGKPDDFDGTVSLTEK